MKRNEYIIWALNGALILAIMGLGAALARAEYPYDSVCRVLTRSSGGSGTLIQNVEGKYAVVLSVKHVAGTPGEWVSCRWGETVCEGRAWRVHPNADLCLLLVASPPGLRPVEVAVPSAEVGPFVLAGFPSYSQGKLHYQVGSFRELDRYTLYVNCAPWSGMSGGACFDRFGRVVGAVATAHPGIRRGVYGGVTSGQALAELIEQ